MSGSIERVKVSKTERLLNLISFMLRSRRPVPFSSIAGKVVGYDDVARLDSIEKRFDRDKAELRNMGIPVEYVDLGGPDVSGYVIPRDKFFLGKLELDAADAILLAASGREEGFAQSSMLIKDAFASAMRKLSIDVPDVDETPVATSRVVQADDGSARVGDLLPTVCSATYHRRRITFKYRGVQDAQAQKRVVDPYGFGIARGQWYLAGFDRDRDAVRSYRLSRIESGVSFTGASDSGPEFDIPSDFRISDRLGAEGWQFGDAEPVEVKVSVPVDLANQIRLTAGFDYAITDAEDDTADVVLAIHARGPERVVEWLMSFGPAARIVSPPAIVALARERLKGLAARYTDAGEGEAS